MQQHHKWVSAPSDRLKFQNSVEYYRKNNVGAIFIGLLYDRNAGTSDKMESFENSLAGFFRELRPEHRLVFAKDNYNLRGIELLTRSNLSQGAIILEGVRLLHGASAQELYQKLSEKDKGAIHSFLRNHAKIRLVGIRRYIEWLSPFLSECAARLHLTGAIDMKEEGHFIFPHQQPGKKH